MDFFVGYSPERINPGDREHDFTSIVKVVAGQDFKKPSHADDSEMTDDNVIIRYEKGEIVGITVLNASKRKGMV